MLLFGASSGGAAEPVTVDLPTDKRIRQLRLDVSPGPGKATIADLQLSDQLGNVLITWPNAGDSRQRQPKDQR